MVLVFYSVPSYLNTELRHVLILKMQSKFLEVFLESTVKYGKLYGPVKKNGHLSYDHVEDIKDVVLGDEHPMIPIKKLFNPMRCDMMKFDDNGFIPDYSMFEKRVIIGVPLSGIHSLLVLDRVFMKDPVDPYYAEQRKNSIIIGFSCEPGENSLEIHTGTDRVDEGFDLFFVNLGEFYLVWVGSSIGHDLVYSKEEFFEEELSSDDVKKYIIWQKNRDSLFKQNFEFDNIPEIMDMSYNSEIWEYFADKCISCGQCSMVCPTCNCYNTTDYFDVTNKSTGRRERTWDSCMFVDYSLVAGGHNFREKRADRLKLWYTHKLKAFGGEFGKPSCVGCGRCVDTCPVDINVLTISKALIEQKVPQK